MTNGIAVRGCVGDMSEVWIEPREASTVHDQVTREAIQILIEDWQMPSVRPGIVQLHDEIARQLLLKPEGPVGDRRKLIVRGVTTKTRSLTIDAATWIQYNVGCVHDPGTR